MAGSNDWLSPIERRPISTILVETLTNQLLTGELSPGDKLPTELEFADKLGVGRNSVREAMKMLSALGIIEIKRGQGTFITDSPSLSTLHPLVLSLAVTQPTTRELVELRFAVDGGIAELACNQMTEAALSRLQEINDALSLEIEKERHDIERILQLDFDFHVALIEATGNKMIEKLGKTIYSLYFESMRKGLSLEPRRAYQDHRRLIAALRANDPAQVRNAVEESVKGWEDLIDQ